MIKQVFARGFSTEDHMFTFTMIYEKCTEFQLNGWVAAIDFKKAFDSISHSFLWKSLSNQGVPKGYIRLLRHLYDDQVGFVKTDVKSRGFHILRGTKQGDPLSSLLFNSVLEQILGPLKIQWEQKQYGLQMGPSSSTRITNLRFADDVLLIGRSLPQIKQMLQ